MIQITHTPTEGTLLTGTTKGDGTWELIRPCGWRWSRNLAAFYLPRSRDLPANGWKITRTVEALRAAGHEVETDIDRSWRPTAEVEADKIARQDARVEALAAKADRATAANDAAQARAQGALDRLPDNGQPILVGHHSEGRHRRAIARADAAMRASIEATETAEEAQRRVSVAQATTGARYSVTTVGNRIEKLRADVGRIRRHLDGHTRATGTPYAEQVPGATGRARERYTAELERLSDQLAYWEQVRAQQIADGTAGDFSPATVAKGDHVRTRFGWHLVMRANAKSVTLAGEFGPGRVPWHEVKAHRAAPAEPAT